MQKRLIIFGVVLLVLFASAVPIFAHGGEEEGNVDIPTLVKQSIAFIEGLEDTDMALDKLNEAIASNEEKEIVNGQQLEQAKVALENGELDKAKLLMVEAIGGNDRNIEYQSNVSINGTNIVLSILGILSVLGGVMLLKRKPAEQGGMKHE